MTPRHGERHRSLALVAASLPARCAVCSGSGRVGVVALEGIRGSGAVRCPHCSNGPDAPIPIYIWPMRDDLPNEVA